MLDTQALKDFQAAVGDAYVSDDPTIIVSYAWNVGSGGGRPSNRIAAIRPVAILLPSTTEEVQAIVKACLRNDLHYHAQSTGMLSFGVVKQERSVVIDLRRMNRIIKLDAANQMAVIEPYATVGDLMTAAMKVGLTSHSVGAGWTHSPLASATSLFGIGITGNHTGQNSRNLLAYEWVTPTGDIVRGGSAGSDCGWFAGEGPGPGFRGVIRGNCGAMGALGVFTKIGYKLHPWYGKPEMEHIGEQPNMGLKLSDQERIYQCVWSDWDNAVEATYELTASKAATFILRMPGDHHAWTLALSNREYYDQVRSGTLPEIARDENGISWTLMAVSATPAEAAWRDRTIRDIVSRSSGRILKLDPHHEAMIARNLVTSSFVARALRGGVAGSMTSFGVSDSISLMPKVIERGERLMRPYKKDGARFTKGSPEQFWSWTNESRSLWMENIIPINSADDNAVGDGFAYAMQAFDENEREPLGSSAFTVGPDASDMFGPKLGHVNKWMRKIKGALDPKWKADGDYINEKEQPVARLFPIMRHVLFRSRWLLSRLMVHVMTTGGK